MIVVDSSMKGWTRNLPRIRDDRRIELRILEKKKIFRFGHSFRLEKGWKMSQKYELQSEFQFILRFITTAWHSLQSSVSIHRMSRTLPQHYYHKKKFKVTKCNRANLDCIPDSETRHR